MYVHTASMTAVPGLRALCLAERDSTPWDPSGFVGSWLMSSLPTSGPWWLHSQLGRERRGRLCSAGPQRWEARCWVASRCCPWPHIPTNNGTKRTGAHLSLSPLRSIPGGRCPHPRCLQPLSCKRPHCLQSHPRLPPLRSSLQVQALASSCSGPALLSWLLCSPTPPQSCRQASGVLHLLCPNPQTSQGSH